MSEATPRWRRWVRIGTIQLAVVVLTASVCAHLFIASADLEAVNGSIWDWNAREGLRVRRNTTTELHRPADFTVRTDARGARIGTHARSTPSQVDVMVVGCSFAFGWGVEADETFSTVAAREVGASVTNLGYPGASTTASLRALERNADLRPKVVVYTFIDDHVRRNLSPCAPVPAARCLSVPYVSWATGAPEIVAPVGTRADFDDAFRHGELARRNRWIDAPRIAALGAVTMVRQLSMAREDASEVALRGESTLAFLLRRMDTDAKRMGARFVVLYIPEHLTAHGARAPEALRRALPPGVPLVDASQSLAEGGRHGASLRVPRDGHPNAHAHHLIARALEPVLARELQGPAVGSP